MRPTQRNLMKKSILLLSLLFSTTFPVVAGQDVDIVANIKNNTCQSGISNNGNIDLGVVGVGDLPETFQPKIITPVEKSSLLQYRTAHFRAQGMC